jgi:predicted Zn-dependent protease
VKHPGTNAFAFGDGTIGIHTGLLIQISNEAQLATVLAHEIVHFIHNHPFNSYQNAKGNSAFWMTLSIGSGGIAALPALIALPAGISGYSRSIEREADLEGWERLVRAGYDGREAPKVFDLFKQNLEEEGESEPFFFSSHPNLDRRIENFQELLIKSDLDWTNRQVNQKEYLDQVAFLVEETIILNLESGYTLRARRLIDHEAKLRGESAMTAFLRAESARRDPNSEIEEVHSLFRIATAYPDAEADAWKGHGLTAMKLDFNTEALTAFKQYLKLKPDAQDRDHIEYYLEQCTQNQP